ncbi:MAG: hypothetical protein DIU79_01740 [Actinobacteria bacterium]|nr:MAG: hypothetical protein DIU79_01740 [Actinomycetota bacterium]
MPRQQAQGDRHVADPEGTTMASQQLPVFVYGTLRHGQSNYASFLAGHTSKEESAVLVGARIYDAGHYPYVDYNPASPATGSRVVGELMHIASDRYQQVMERLDMLEGYHPGSQFNHYERIATDVQRADGTPVRAWVYVVSPARRDSYLAGLTPIDSGDWVAHRANNCR